jgi:uncharacterized protein YegL
LGNLTVTQMLDGLKKTKDPTEALSKISKSLTVQTDKVLLILIDVSGSMSESLGKGTTKIQALWQAMQKDLAPKLSGWTYGVIAFGDFAVGVKWLIGPTDKPEKILIMKQPSADGSTPMKGALQMAWDWSKINAQKVRFILITDGFPTDCRTDGDILSLCFANKTIPIDTIGVGSNKQNYDEKFLRKICEITGGVFSKVNSVNTLTDTLVMLSPEKRLLLGTTK